ncbi:E3 SUMO-protein ligase NSE2-like [Xenia sp. Carnegie-2017]|uniref:E3 SUMO-protein ligase NSE2-like n=1 Tax=Xenia sp. Carnegie-2017 TaxID=2897299 RepID=UPI001F038733|nr:E3 SUMO-protein ligase NSE2-like [Xenia sp. Carnegie-2017]
MAGCLQYSSVDNAVAKLSKIQEYLDLGYSTTLDVALDVEESNFTGEASPHVEKLKEITMLYTGMEQELKRYLKASELTKIAFKKDYEKLTDGSVPDIEEIFKKKLEETEPDVEDLNEHAQLKEFVKQIWYVHHNGEPLPSDAVENDDADIIVAQASEESVICPLTQQQMVEPVRSKQCHHNYERMAILQHLKSRNKRVRCPIAGCSHYVVEGDLEANHNLAFRIKRLQRKP